ncbi:TolC family protein [Desulforhopalus singaporensis]|uniref:Outer membrane protein TolC n=1 Tax=Desulforhopalus singaporensis TaxID=91360 RepID=A0A1H0LJM6_9BACT|nr:TolC family protein [Desulforhopalus singaporensis]SDO68374.1 Outer membrane protein TolC [Desulforhopalus singaporensis]
MNCLTTHLGRFGVYPAVVAVILLLFGCVTPDYWYGDQPLYTPEGGDMGDSPVEEQVSLPTRQPTPLPTAEDGKIAIFIEDAVFLCLQQNPELLVERYNPMIALSFEQIERGRYDPEIFGELQYLDETATEVSRSTRERFSVEGRDVNATAGVRQQLPTGTEIEATFGGKRSISNRTPEQQDFRVGLTLTQSLLKGFGPATNLADIRLAELDSRASYYQLRGFIETLVSEVEIGYWQYVFAEQGIAIFERSLEVARKQLAEVENRIEVGVIPKNAAAAARTEVARRQQALIEARSIHAERRLRLMRLLNVTGSDRFSLQLITRSSPQTATAPLDDLSEHVQLAMKLRADLGEAGLQQKKQELEVVRTRNGLLPKLDFFIDIGKTGYAESFRGAVSDLENDSYDLLTGLRFSSYLDNRSARGRHQAATVSRAQAAAAVDNLKSLIAYDVLAAANEVNRAEKKIEASRVTRMLQEQTLEAEQERFAVGNVTSLLVAQAQRDLLVSQLDEVEAKVDYRIALVRFFLAEGSLLERRGIKLDSALAGPGTPVL